MDTVRVLVGDKQYVTLYTMDKINGLISTGTVLPIASSAYRGTLFALQSSSGAADILYVCLKQADDSYAWKDLLTFRFAP